MNICVMRIIFVLLCICYLNSAAFAKKTEAPDPLYLSTPVLEADDSADANKSVDQRTLNEKFRSKFHLPPTKKIYLHNIDKSKQPVTMEDYLNLAKDIKRKDFSLPSPSFEQESDIILPDAKFRIVKFNNPPGQRNIDVSSLVSARAVVSDFILSPDKSKIVYTKAFFYPQFSQSASAAYLIPVGKNKDAYDALYSANPLQGSITPFLTAGTDEFINFRFKTLFPIDWSKDSSKIAFKEKTGSNINETWQTDIIVYDFNKKSSKRLSAVREAIIYWWRNNKQIDLKDYMWDIFPVGWDKSAPDRLIVYAYAYTNDKPMFLGTWSIDSDENKSSLISIDSASAEIELNGFGIKKVINEN